MNSCCFGLHHLLCHGTAGMPGQQACVKSFQERQHLASCSALWSHTRKEAPTEVPLYTSIGLGRERPGACCSMCHVCLETNQLQRARLNSLRLFMCTSIGILSSICVCAYTHTYVYIFTCLYAHIHIYTHACSLIDRWMGTGHTKKTRLPPIPLPPDEKQLRPILWKPVEMRLVDTWGRLEGLLEEQGASLEEPGGPDAGLDSVSSLVS